MYAARHAQGREFLMHVPLIIFRCSAIHQAGYMAATLDRLLIGVRVLSLSRCFCAPSIINDHSESQEKTKPLPQIDDQKR